MSGPYGPEYRDAARTFASGLSGAAPNVSGTIDMWSAGKGRIARSLKGTPVVQRVRSWACHRALKLAVWLGFPFGGLTISHHSPLGYGQPHKSATSITLVWRGRTYTGFLVPEDPRL